VLRFEKEISWNIADVRGHGTGYKPVGHKVVTAVCWGLEFLVR